MNYIDIVIVVPLIYGIIKGFSNGLIKEVTDLLGLFIGAYIAIQFSSYLYPKISSFLIGYDQFIPIISFVIVFIVSVVFIKTLGYIIDKSAHALALGFVSRLLGAVFGFLKVVIVFAIILSLTQQYKILKKDIQKKSVLVLPLQQVAEIIMPKINKQKEIIIDAAKKNTQKAKDALDKKINSNKQQEIIDTAEQNTQKVKDALSRKINSK